MLPEHSLTERLAHHLLRPVPPAMRALARLHLLDWLGCVAGARQNWPRERTAAWPYLDAAALLGNVLEMDDVHRAAILHPGPVVWPTAIGATGRADRTMGDLLAAAVRGYEATIAVGATFDARHYAHYHNTATAGPFGAATAWFTSWMDEPRDWLGLADALGLAGSVTGGLWRLRHEASDAKQFHVLHAVETGERAATAALRGLRGPRRILEGEQGLYAATCNAPGDLVLGDGWRIAEVSFKPWAACRHAHPAIDAALELKGAGGLARPLLIETYADAIAFCDRPAPTTPIEAKFSLQHAVAVVDRFGEPRPEHFEPEAIAALATDRAGITVREGADFTSRYPAHWGARVSGPGGAVELADTRGDPERPLSRDGVIAKARGLMAWGGISDAEADRAVALALETPEEALPDLGSLLIEWMDPGL